MNRAKVEQRVLATWMGYLDHPPTWLRQIRRAWKVLTFRGLAIVAVTWYLAESQLRATAVFAVGMLLGSLIRDLEWMRKTARLWPIVSDYLNWQKIKDNHKIQVGQKGNQPVEPAG